MTRFSTNSGEPVRAGGLGAEAGAAHGRDVAALHERVVERAVLEVGAVEERGDRRREDGLLDRDRLFVREPQAAEGDDLRVRVELEP